MRICILIYTLFFCVGLLHAEQFRVWRSQSGHEVEAALVRIEESKVYLRRKDSNNVIAIPIETLSSESRGFLVGISKNESSSDIGGGGGVGEEFDAPEGSLLPQNRSDMLVGEKNKSEGVADGVLSSDIPHIYQGRNNHFCATASFLMFLQVQTGLNLVDERYLPLFTYLVEFGNAEDLGATGIPNLANVCGVTSERIYFNMEQKLKYVPDVWELASEKFDEVIIPHLDRGGLVGFSVSNGGRKGSTGHSILVVSYDEVTDSFVGHDPARKKGPFVISRHKLADKWMVVYPEDIVTKYGLEDRIYLGASMIVVKGGDKRNAKLSKFDAPPEKMEIKVSMESFDGLKLPSSIRRPPTDSKRSSVDIRLISGRWGEGVRAEQVEGLATWLKVKVAARDPAVLFFDNENGDFEDEELSKKFPVLVTGYDSGVFQFEGSKLQVTTFKNGQSYSVWMECKDVLKACSSTIEGAYCFYIAYPKETLVDEATEVIIAPPKKITPAKEITILKALYGSPVQFANGEEMDVTQKAKQYVIGGKLYIEHTRQAFGDPHPFKRKLLKVSYLVDGKSAPSGEPWESEHDSGEIRLEPAAVDQ